MSIEANKALVRRYIEEAVNGRDVSILDEIVADSYVGHPGNSRGPAGMKKGVSDALQLFGDPELELEIKELIAERDKVVAHLILHGIHQGQWKHVPPSGKPVEFTEIQIYRIEEGKIAERWFVAEWPPLPE